MTLKMKAKFEKWCGKNGGKCWLPVLSPFPTTFRNISETNQIKRTTFNMLFALLSIKTSLKYFCPAQVAQWWACWTPDLVVVSSIPGWGQLSLRRIFTSHLCWSMWELSRWLWKESCASTGVRTPGNTCASPTFMIWLKYFCSPKQQSFRLKINRDPMKKNLKTVRKIEGKGENDGNQRFLSGFHTAFKNLCLLGHYKSGYLVKI